MKSATVVGTRPEFVQIAPLTKTLRAMGHTELLINTGQHYDDNMSKIFFRELELPEPDISLGVGSGSHAQQTGEMMIRLEKVLLEEKPDYVIVYGDTNSTIAGAIVASKIHIPIVHVESGLRSYDRRMPEEINRILTDHISDILFAPTDRAVATLKEEGLVAGVHNVGDVRVDVLHNMKPKAEVRIPDLLGGIDLSTNDQFAVATIHRPSNTDSAERLRRILHVFGTLDMPIVLPVHPRLRKMMGEFGLSFSDNIRAIDPVGFLDIVGLMSSCSLVITDSGGLQKESYMLKRPTVTLRDTTEWVETVDSGWNRLCEPDEAEFSRAVDEALNHIPAEHPSYYGEVGVSDRMVHILESAL